MAAALANAPPVTPTPACAAWCFCQLWLTRAALLACTGTIGHVAHGKSTVVKAISGVHTVRFKNELERNITIKLGYANAKIYKCHDPECPRPGNFLTRGSTAEDVSALRDLVAMQRTTLSSAVRETRRNRTLFFSLAF